MSNAREIYGETPQGVPVEKFTMHNAQGCKTEIITYGGILVSWSLPSNNGSMDDVILGHDSLDGYLNRNTPYFGCLVGRYANRIANGSFELDAKKYTLSTNENGNTLHGGKDGFNQRVWNVRSFSEKNNELVLSLISPDGDQGFPGKLLVQVMYHLTDNNELHLYYQAVTTKTTVINLTHHAYFNLDGHDSGTILDHEVMIPSSKITELDENLLPNGNLMDVRKTPLDFQKPRSVRSGIFQPHPQLSTGGYDGCWVLNTNRNAALQKAAVVSSLKSNRSLHVYTTEPGLQFYTGNFLNGKITGKNGHAYQQYAGFCTEAQHFADSPNQPQFPSTVLPPEMLYKQHTVFKINQ
jgi:aldose 1-epimerase